MEGMRAMEMQQQRHIKEVYMDSALKSLASDPDNESVSNLSSKSVHTQNTQTQRINEMITQSVKAEKRNGKAKYNDLPGRDDMEPPLDLDEASSSDGQVDMRNHIHVEDYFSSVRDIKNDYMLRELEAERRLKEINENNKIMFKAELHNIQGESEIQNMQQQNVIDDLLTQIQSPCSIFSDKNQNLYFLKILC